MDTVYAVPIAFIFTVVHSNSCRCHSVSYANDYPLSPVKFLSSEKISVKVSQLYGLTRIQPAASLSAIPRFIGGIRSGLILLDLCSNVSFILLDLYELAVKFSKRRWATGSD